MFARRAPGAELREAEHEAENIRPCRYGKGYSYAIGVIRSSRGQDSASPGGVRHRAAGKGGCPALPGLVERYVRDLQSVLGRDTDRARFLLSRLLGNVILRPDKQGFVAEVRGNLGVLLEDVPSIGAGRGILFPAGVCPVHRWIEGAAVRRLFPFASWHPNAGAPRKTANTANTMISQSGCNGDDRERRRTRGPRSGQRIDGWRPRVQPGRLLQQCWPSVLASFRREEERWQ